MLYIGGHPRSVLADVQQPGAGLHQGRREVQGEGRERYLRRVRERLFRDEVSSRAKLSFLRVYFLFDNVGLMFVLVRGSSTWARAI